ncbi:hypothetical protein [Cylindrospermopsis raciborskii]|uniref:hypothetical protein n=1 Tax=Cylindrospermopsis raciborskii TaxID=77022 RepID=UPI003A8FD5E9
MNYSSRNDWFPTPVWNFAVENHQQLNPLLLETIYAEEQRDSKGEKSCILEK